MTSRPCVPFLRQSGRVPARLDQSLVPVQNLSYYEQPLNTVTHFQLAVALIVVMVRQSDPTLHFCSLKFCDWFVDSVFLGVFDRPHSGQFARRAYKWFCTCCFPNTLSEIWALLQVLSLLRFLQRSEVGKHELH